MDSHHSALHCAFKWIHFSPKAPSDNVKDNTAYFNDYFRCLRMSPQNNHYHHHSHVFLFSVSVLYLGWTSCMLLFTLSKHPLRLLFLCWSVCVPGMDGSNDVALYSGLGSGVVVVAVLVVAVMLYRRSQSNYGVDVIDSSALTGGFQSFTFKTTRQGELALPFTLWRHARLRTRPNGRQDFSRTLSTGCFCWWLIACVCIEAARWRHCANPAHLPQIYILITAERICPSILTDQFFCYCWDR